MRQIVEIISSFFGDSRVVGLGIHNLGIGAIVIDFGAIISSILVQLTLNRDKWHLSWDTGPVTLSQLIKNRPIPLTCGFDNPIFSKIIGD